MTPAPDIDALIGESLTRLRLRAPFFATLSLFARYEVTQRIPTAATNGRDILVNPTYFSALRPAERDGVLLHEVLHAALLHVTRRGTRDRWLWNIAADIIVNGVIDQQKGFALPEGVIRNNELRDLAVEEVYYLLSRDGTDATLAVTDLLEDALGGELDAEQRAQMESYWRHALRQADAVTDQLAGGRGDKTRGLLREMGMIAEARLDWRTYLWRFLVQTPTDFGDFDRRFIGQGLYLEGIQGETLRVSVCIDTSGSVTTELMGLLLSELRGILRAYPHLHCTLYYADADLYGPYELAGDGDIPAPVGGGGTDFRPFFAALAKNTSGHDHGAAIYLTDGYGAFPDKAPPYDVLWVVSPGGLRPREFPFGEAVAILE